MYISDGMRADNATQIDTKAWDAINAFINWQISPNHAISSPERRVIDLQRRLVPGSAPPFPAGRGELAEREAPARKKPAVGHGDVVVQLPRR